MTTGYGPGSGEPGPWWKQAFARFVRLRSTYENPAASGPPPDPPRGRASPCRNHATSPDERPRVLGRWRWIAFDGLSVDARPRPRSVGQGKPEGQRPARSPDVPALPEQRAQRIGWLALRPLQDAWRPDVRLASTRGPHFSLPLRCGRHDWRAKVTTNARSDPSRSRERNAFSERYGLLSSVR